MSKVKIVDYEVVSRLPLETSTLRSEIDVIRSRSLNEEVVVKLGLMIRPCRGAGSPRVAIAVAICRPRHARRARPLSCPGSLGRIRRRDDDVPMVTRSQLTDWLIGNLNASNDGRSLTIVVSFTSESPERAAQIANAVAQTYLDDQALVKNAVDNDGQRLARAKGDQRYEQDLEKSEAAVDDYRRKAGLLPVKGDTIPAERLGDLNAQLSNARLERMRAEVKLQTARESGPESLPDVFASPMIQTLRKDLIQINTQIAAESPVQHLL